MAGQIIIKKDEIEEHAEELITVTQYFRETLLNSVDNRSTISANNNAQEAFADSQKALARFGEALEQEAEQIRSLNLTFQELDEMMGKLLEQGMRYPTITTLN
ncbi:MAG: TIGR04197 family type VII secretion effector [Bacteroides sp.]|nr:TIGR04197 family type VII secretion effector [Bacteroides sp.]MCM1550931.1 TIGR04197 family type VII secretion effector [Clostridium sp.]